MFDQFKKGGLFSQKGGSFFSIFAPPEEELATGQEPPPPAAPKSAQPEQKEAAHAGAAAANSAQEQLNPLKDKITSLEKETSAQKNLIAELRATLESHQQGISSISASIARLEAMGLQDRIHRLDEEQAGLREMLTRLWQSLARAFAGAPGTGEEAPSEEELPLEGLKELTARLRGLDKVIADIRVFNSVAETMAERTRYVEERFNFIAARLQQAEAALAALTPEKIRSEAAKDWKGQLDLLLTKQVELEMKLSTLTLRTGQNDATLSEAVKTLQFEVKGLNREFAALPEIESRFHSMTQVFNHLRDTVAELKKPTRR